MVLALGVLAGLIVLGGSRLVRVWSRAREQDSVVFAVQMEVMALAQATVLRCDAVDPNGHGAYGASLNGQASREVAQARAALGRNIGLLKDDTLRQITREMIDCSGRLPASPRPADAAAVREQVRTLQERFRQRSDEVQREMRLGRR